MPSTSWARGVMPYVAHEVDKVDVFPQGAALWLMRFRTPIRW